MIVVGKKGMVVVIHTLREVGDRRANWRSVSLAHCVPSFWSRAMISAIELAEKHRLMAASLAFSDGSSKNDRDQERLEECIRQHAPGKAVLNCSIMRLTDAGSSSEALFRAALKEVRERERQSQSRIRYLQFRHPCRRYVVRGDLQIETIGRLEPNAKKTNVCANGTREARKKVAEARLL